MGVILLIFKKCFSLIFFWNRSLKILMIREIKLFQFIIVLQYYYNAKIYS